MIESLTLPLHISGFACVLEISKPLYRHLVHRLLYYFVLSRQMLDSAVRAHRKQMTSIQSAVSNIGPREVVKAQTPLPSPELSLHKGKYNCRNSNVTQIVI